MQILSSNAIGVGFMLLPTGTQIRTSDQFFDSAQQRWVISSYFTSSGEINRGRTMYRRAVSLRTKLSLVPQVIGKVWRKKVKPLWASKP